MAIILKLKSYLLNFIVLSLLLATLEPSEHCFAQSNTLSVAKSTTTTTTRSGIVTLEIWNNIPGNSISNIPTSTTPTSLETLTSLETPTNTDDHYGVRIRGYIIPTTTGDYTFYIASDGNGQFSLSTNYEPSNLVIGIASVGAWTGLKDWTKYTSQKSTAKNLTAGNKYYFEALMKESIRNDNLAIGWTGPDISTITVIDSTHIEQYIEGTLPVSLVNFSGKATSTGNVLSWRTASEQNNSGFEVLRSQNGTDFEKIGFEKSLGINGNSGATLDYSFNDAASGDDLYYQLNQIDIDGKHTSSSTILVRAGLATENQVYPNPVVNNLNIVLNSSKVDMSTINVIDQKGKVVIAKQEKLGRGRSAIRLDTSNLVAGWYLLNIRDAAGKQMLSKKIIKF